MSGGTKRFTVTYKVEVLREEELADGRLANPVGMPVYTMRVSNLPAAQIAEGFELFMRHVQSQEGKANLGEILHNISTAADVDDLLLRDVERIERNR